VYALVAGKRWTWACVDPSGEDLAKAIALVSHQFEAE
jgi:hypothetical protein